MPTTIKSPSRRQFLRSTARFSAGSLAFGWLATNAAAETKPEKVSEDSSLAKSLHYHNDASQVDMAAHKEGQMCANCQFFTGQSGDKWGPCQIFQRTLVSAKGWYMSYTAAS